LDMTAMILDELLLSLLSLEGSFMLSLLLSTS
jgi:hypothetical protein